MASIAKLEPKAKAGTVHWFNECVERGKRALVTEVATITPGLAGVMLTANDSNRNLSEKKIREYARDMIAGRWTFNGEPIIVSDTGELNDGQHRLQAVIEANAPQQFLIVFGLARETRTTVDQGMARTSAHYLSMRGVKSSALSAGLARIVMAFEQSNGSQIKMDLTHAEVVARVMADDQVAVSAAFAEQVRTFAKGLLTPSQIGACHYLFSDIDTTDARQFLEQVCIGESIKRGDPAFAVRQALANVEGEKRLNRVEIVMRGWVAFRQGRKLQLAKQLDALPALV